jgi:polygalacturonase
MISGAAVNVIDFGADASGTTDSTTAIQAALDQQGDVYLPEGTFSVSSVEIKSNTRFFGPGVLKARTNEQVIVTTGSSADKSNITIEGITIDGNASTVRGVVGIGIYRATNVKILGCTIYDCGIANPSHVLGSPDDGSYGGHGIQVSYESGNTVNTVLIDGCVVSNIGGNGYIRGDGIDIVGSYTVGSSTTYEMNVKVTNCSVNNVARHCYTIEGSPTHTLPRNVIISNCQGSSSALSGIDVEDGVDLIVSDCYFPSCGNSTTFYNPQTEFGADYRLCAGFATTNDSSNLTFTNVTVTGSYFGSTIGNTDGLTLSDCYFYSNSRSDCYLGTAGFAVNASFTGCKFMSAASALPLLNHQYLSGNSSTSFVGCTFANQVQMIYSFGLKFVGCEFRKGVLIPDNSTFQDNIFQSCYITDSGSATIGISAVGANDAANIKNNTVDGCIFKGTGTMAQGIRFGFNSAYNWKISNNQFINTVSHGILCENQAAFHFCDVIGNSFNGTADAIVLSQGGKNSLVVNNDFQNVSGWCIDASGILSGSNMENMTIMGNLAGDSCINGVRVGVSTGSWDWCIVTNNNMHNCSGTKWTLAAGNANGVIANNLTT